jgi:hypothetical protein
VERRALPRRRCSAFDNCFDGGNSPFLSYVEAAKNRRPDQSKQCNPPVYAPTLPSTNRMVPQNCLTNAMLNQLIRSLC